MEAMSTMLCLSFVFADVHRIAEHQKTIYVSVPLFHLYPRESRFVLADDCYSRESQ